MSARPFVIVFVCALALVACRDKHGTAIEQPIPASAPPHINGADIMVELSRLADDSMLGRGSTTADERVAANYIHERFTAAALQSPVSGGLQQFLVTNTTSSQNVVATLPGRGALKDEWIVVGAHYDHVGVKSGVIYNGADDNASGASALLALASQLGQYVNGGGAGTVDRRSIEFVAFGAEELGLIGSTYYCNHPVVSLDATYAMVNFDMIGRLADTVWVGGLATSPNLGNIVSDANTERLLIAGLVGMSGRTDYYCFANAGRPAIWFFTGLHADYHKPTDDIKFIKQSGLEAITNLAQRIIVYLALTPNALK